MEYLLLALSVTAAGVRNGLSRLCKKKSVHLFNTIVFLLALIVVFFISLGEDFSISWYSVLIALFYAGFTLMAQLFSLRAIRIGDIGLSSLVYHCGFIIPTIFSAIVWKEDFGALKLVGIIIILSAFVLSTERKGKIGGIAWLVSAILGLCGSGLVGITQKIYMKSGHGNELTSMLLMVFALLSIVSFILYLTTERSKLNSSNTSVVVENKKEFTITAIAGSGMGVCIALANKINTYLSGVIPGVIFFPVVNGGSILLSMVVGFVFFKEKATFKKMLSILLGIIAIILMVC